MEAGGVEPPSKTLVTPNFYDHSSGFALALRFSPEQETPEAIPRNLTGRNEVRPDRPAQVKLVRLGPLRRRA